MNTPLRIAMIAGLAEWAAKYPEAAELLFDSPEEYVEQIENAYSEINSKYAGDLTDEEYAEHEYWVRADDMRATMAKNIKERFAVRKQAAE